jgi:methionyl-tRNA formyltransferase
MRQISARIMYALRDCANRIRRFGTLYPPKSLAHKYDVDHVSTESVNTDSYAEYVRELNPDIIVAAGATERFEPELLSIPKKGCVNVHDSLLPDYRGIMPSFWVLRHGEHQTGVTVHQMVPELDAGNIFVQRQVNIDRNDSYHSLRLRTAAQSGEALVEALNDIATDSCDPEPLNVDEGSYYSFPEREDVRAFRRAGRTFY